MWDLPGPGLEPMSPALAGGFSTIAPPGKPLPLILKNTFLLCGFLFLVLFTTANRLFQAPVYGLQNSAS